MNNLSYFKPKTSIVFLKYLFNKNPANLLNRQDFRIFFLYRLFVNTLLVVINVNDIVLEPIMILYIRITIILTCCVFINNAIGEKEY